MTRTPEHEKEAEAAIGAALSLIRATPNYAPVADALELLRKQGYLTFNATLPDRATTDWQGHIVVGPEAAFASVVGLAETLVHEQFHRTQPVYAKTLSFWGGVFTQSSVWERLERPAYRAAYDFLSAVENYSPTHAEVARQEKRAVKQSFQANYNAPLFPI